MKIYFSLLAIFLTFFPFNSFSQSSGDKITIVTYYPSPFGVYKTLQVLNDNEEVLIGNDTNNPSIELRDRDVTGNAPYIDFSNDSSTDYDFRLILMGNDQFWIRGGRTSFANDNGTPAIIRAKEVWFCSSY